MAKKKKVYVPVETQQQSNKNDLLEQDPVAPKVEPYTTPFSQKTTYTDPTTGKSIMIRPGEGVDPTMINEGETVIPDDVVVVKDMVQRTKEMLLRRFGRKNTIVTGPMGLMTPVTVMQATAFGTEEGADVSATAEELGLVAETDLDPTLDSYLENYMFESS